MVEPSKRQTSHSAKELYPLSTLPSLPDSRLQNFHGKERTMSTKKATVWKTMNSALKLSVFHTTKQVNFGRARASL